MKKLLSTIMALVMLLSLVPMAVAEEGVAAKNAVAQVGDMYYDVLYDAVAAVEPGGTVTLLQDATGGGVGTYTTGGKDYLERDKIVAKSFTLDFAGHTYTVSEPAVGSKGYESQGFHLERGDGNVSVTLKNGTLASAGSAVKMLVQNYCNLTLENMTLEGTGIELSTGAYVLSNNCGNVTIKDTTIDARKGDVAFDVYGGFQDYSDVTVTVTGNSVINGKVELARANTANQNKNKLVIDGGTINGQICNNNGTVVVKGGAFTDLASAVKYAADGAKITLAGNVALDKAISIGSSEGKTIVLDLGGKTLKGNIDFYAGDLTIQNGTIDGCVYANATETDVKYGHLTIASDAVIDSKYAVILYQGGVGAKNFGSTIDVYGTLKGNLWVMGNITTDLATAKNPCVVNIHDGAVIDSRESSDIGIALNGAAKMTVGKASITSTTGIEVRAGELTVNGATVVGTGVPTNVTPNGSGTTTDGAGIAVAQHTTKLPIKVTINSGDISGYSALYQSNPEKNDAESVEKVSVAVNGGTFKAINGGTVSVYSENNCVAVSRGTFSSNPSAYVADKSLEVSKDTAGQYTVSKKTNAAETSEVKLPAARTEGTTEAKIDKGDIDTGKDLTVSSEVASVTINQKGVEAIGNNSDLTLTVKTVDQPNDANKAAYDEAIKGNDTASAIVVDIKLSAGSGNAFTQAVEGAYALVTVKYDASGKADKLKVFYLNGSVKQELTKVNDAANGAVNTFSYDDTNKEITMKLPHFSQYLITTTATTSGGNSVIKTGAGSSAASGTHTVTTDLTPGSITKVTVDGKVVDAKYYTVSGSNVTFTAEFLKTLKNGSHTVTVENATKIAKGVFTVNNPTTAVQAPTTADAGIALYAGMAIASVMGTGVVFTSRKRKNH